MHVIIRNMKLGKLKSLYQNHFIYIMNIECKSYLNILLHYHIVDNFSKIEDILLIVISTFEYLWFTFKNHCST